MSNKIEELEKQLSKFMCPIGMDSNPLICSSGTCYQCVVNRLMYYYENGEVKMDKVFSVIATTESGDDYTFVFRNKPSREDVVKRIHEMEGEIEDLSFYQETLSVRIEENEIIEN